MKYLLLLLFASSFLFSQNIMLDDLLKEYEDSESLYKKTKQESAGFLIVYSRDDLERMQAYSLADILKTIRMYSMQVNNMGRTSIFQAGAGKASSPPIKLYIDDFEISTVIQRNAFDMYGDMDLYFVDHIEIYQGASSIAFGNEPGSMVVRLYSKDPNRENSRSLQVGLDSQNSLEIRAVDAGKVEGYNYLLYASGIKKESDKYRSNNHQLSRDGKRYQTHFRVSKDDNFIVDFDTIFNYNDIFGGFGTAPLGDEIQRSYGYLNIIKYFPNDIEFSISASQESKELSNSDEIGIKLVDGTLTKSIHIRIKSNTYKSSLKKRFINDNSDLLIGAEFQRKTFNLQDYSGLNSLQDFKNDRLDIYMLYLEELYNINPEHLVTVSAKFDYYDNVFLKNSKEHSVKLGYTALWSKAWQSKLFAINKYVYPTLFQTSFSAPNYNINPDLASMDINIFGSEIQYNQQKNKIIFGLAYKEMRNALSFDKVHKKYINNSQKKDFVRYYLRGEYNFDIDNKISTEIFKIFKEVYSSPTSGGMIQLFNRFGKFDIYNELIYRKGYTLNFGDGDIDIADGYDYSVAISYLVNHQLKIKLKAENLLDKASESLVNSQTLLKIPTIERRAVITMEYTF